jgi:membrane associated rhomboid family serine protease
MSLFKPFACSARCMFGARARFCQLQSVLPKQQAGSGQHARFKSGRAHLSRPHPAASIRRSTAFDIPTVQGKPNIKIGSAKKASPHQNALQERVQVLDASRHINAARTTNPSPINDVLASLASNQASARDRNAKSYKELWTVDSRVTHIMEKELVYKERVDKKRRQILWPGIWTLITLAGTYGTLAYLDVKAGLPSSDGSHLPTRVQLPQNWALTPEVVRAGVVAGWRELDSLTISIVLASVAIQLLIKSKPSIWRKLIHVTGEARWTAFTNPLLHNNWKSLALSMASLVWFLPSVVYYFDGDLFHTTAFLLSVPLTTSYLTFFAYRFNLVHATICLAGPSGFTYGLFGIYCIAYAQEKLWLPAGLVFRLDACHWGLLFWVFQACRLAQTSNIAKRSMMVVGHMNVQYDILLTSRRFTRSISRLD